MKPNTRDYYLGKENLPTESARFKYTPEMVKRLKKAKKNLLYFAEQFLHTVNLDTARPTANSDVYQKQALRLMGDNRGVGLL